MKIREVLMLMGWIMLSFSAALFMMGEAYGNQGYMGFLWITLMSAIVLSAGLFLEKE